MVGKNEKELPEELKGELEKEVAKLSPEKRQQLNFQQQAGMLIEDVQFLSACVYDESEEMEGKLPWGQLFFVARQARKMVNLIDRLLRPALQGIDRSISHECHKRHLEDPETKDLVCTGWIEVPKQIEDLEAFEADLRAIGIDPGFFNPIGRRYVGVKMSNSVFLMFVSLFAGELAFSLTRDRVDPESQEDSAGEDKPEGKEPFEPRIVEP